MSAEEKDEVEKPGKMGGQNRVDLTDDQVRQVGEMSRFGLTMDQISKVLGVGVATIKRIAARDKRVADTLKKSKEDMDEKVLQTALRMATDGKSAAMTIFWLKARMGWKESQRIEHTGKDGSPISTKSVVDWSKVSTDDLKRIQKIKDKAAKDSESGGGEE